MSSQGRDRPTRSALRFSQTGLAGTGGCSALSLLASQRAEAATLPFHRKGRDGLTKRVDVRVSPAEKEQLRGIAASAGMSVAELVRLRALGRPVVSRTDATTIRELRRLGGLLKKVHLDSGGAYRDATARALMALTDAITALGGQEGRQAGRHP